MRRKARKAFSSHFAKKLFAGRFGDNWKHHKENFLTYCEEWEVEEGLYIYTIAAILRRNLSVML